MTTTIRNYTNKLISDAAGSITVEAAILISFIIAPLFIGAVDFGTAIYEWKRVNDALQAQIIYIAATHGTSMPSNAQQLYSQPNFSTAGISSIKSSGYLSSTQMKSSDITTIITYSCGCVNGTSLSLTGTFSSSQPYCPSPPDISCNKSSYWAPYVTIQTSHQHTSFFTSSFGYRPLLKASATIRMN